jgi:3-isopropylmalate dehydrogenase
VRPIPALADASPMRAGVIAGTDLLVVRELTGGIYFGEKTRTVDSASDTCVYTVAEVERIARVAFAAAGRRSRRVTSVDKANVLETSRLWRKVTTRVVAEEFPDVTLDHVLVDACAMHLVTNPSRFDVIVTENMFGDILTDEAAVIAGSIGVLPSASLGAPGESGRSVGLYEPIHGSAPDIAGNGIANPIAAIWAGAMMLDHLGERAAHDRILAAIESVLADERVKTPDLGGRAATADMTRAVTAAMSARQPV